MQFGKILKNRSEFWSKISILGSKYAIGQHSVNPSAVTRGMQESSTNRLKCQFFLVRKWAFWGSYKWLAEFLGNQPPAARGTQQPPTNPPYSLPTQNIVSEGTSPPDHNYDYIVRSFKEFVRFDIGKLLYFQGLLCKCVLHKLRKIWGYIYINFLIFRLNMFTVMEFMEKLWKSMLECK